MPGRPAPLAGQRPRRRGALAGTARSTSQVEPGNTEIERGTALLVVARFGGAVPADASLVVDGPGAHRGAAADDAEPAKTRRSPAASSRSTPTSPITSSSPAGAAETYHVRVFEYPELEPHRRRLVFPQYTSLVPKTVEDIRHVTAVEGTELTLLCRLNKDVATARLVDEKGAGDRARRPTRRATTSTAPTFTLTDPRRFKVKLVDREGRPNKLAAEIVVNVTRNRPAVVKMTQPARDVRVSPVEELTLKAKLEDDFGLVRHGLSYSVAGEEPREIVLNGPQPPGGQEGPGRAPARLRVAQGRARPARHLLLLGRGHRPRRPAAADLGRHVLRRGPPFRGDLPPGRTAAERIGRERGAAGGATPSRPTKLAELQKEIINGTWKLIRRETGAKPSAKFAEDSKTLQESQHSAIEQAERPGRAASRRGLESEPGAGDPVHEGGRKAPDRGGPDVVDRGAPPGARRRAGRLPGLAQAPRPRIRGHPPQLAAAGSGRGLGGSPSDRQLQRARTVERGEPLRGATLGPRQKEQHTQQEREQGENRQVLNRLRELAQRQSDLNERLKELQSALEAAKDPQARAEIERQLKRLRDQEQQILRDTDELRERMEREENRDRMADARQQIEQSREHVRQASEALEEGRLSQAVTEGTAPAGN